MSSELESFIVQLRSAGVPYSRAVHDFRKQFIWTLLARHHGNQCKAAKALGVHRNTIKHMLNELETILCFRAPGSCFAFPRSFPDSLSEVSVPLLPECQDHLLWRGLKSQAMPLRLWLGG